MMSDIIRRTGSIKGKSQVSEGGVRMATTPTHPPQILHGSTICDIHLTELNTGTTLYKNGKSAAVSFSVFFHWNSIAFIVMNQCRLNDVKLFNDQNSWIVSQQRVTQQNHWVPYSSWMTVFFLQAAATGMFTLQTVGCLHLVDCHLLQNL